MLEDSKPASPVYQCVVYLKSGATVTTETSDSEGFIRSLSGYMDGFFRRRLFGKTNSTVRLCGTPTVCVPIDHVNFFTVQEKQPR